MTNPTQLLPTSLVAVEVPKDSYDFEKENVPEENWHQLIWHDDNKDEESGFYGECQAHQIDIGSDFEILTEVTADEITFDVEAYVRKVTLGYWLDYCNPFKRHDIMCSTPKESFYSLLQSKELYFVNPIEKPEWRYKNSDERWGTSDVNPEWIKWQSAESKVIKGKLVILKKV